MKEKKDSTKETPKEPKKKAAKKESGSKEMDARLSRLERGQLPGKESKGGEEEKEKG